MSDGLVKATTYHLSDDDIKVTFSMVNPADLELVYEDIQGERQFSGQSIDLQVCHHGLMVIVVLEEVPDLYSITLSFAVPAANRPTDARSIPVKTFAVRTMSRTSIAGPDTVEGQLQIYETYVLQGNAW
ncbi:MAG: hypothetical protein KJ558_00990 [Gammaproteobacteria bacterium]|nr:hypothetical protein [Gammaproteobacteria bacterium]MBU1653411.1 hypothetical protein [Gammaproteobacteria bacterium]MBU1962093.1 hypothetical protein [Gammaproteobacteria bacterium]